MHRHFMNQLRLVCSWIQCYSDYWLDIYSIKGRSLLQNAIDVSIKQMPFILLSCRFCPRCIGQCMARYPREAFIHLQGFTRTAKPLFCQFTYIEPVDWIAGFHKMHPKSWSPSSYSLRGSVTHVISSSFLFPFNCVHCWSVIKIHLIISTYSGAHLKRKRKKNALLS